MYKVALSANLKTSFFESWFLVINNGVVLLTKINLQIESKEIETSPEALI